MSSSCNAGLRTRARVCARWTHSEGVGQRLSAQTVLTEVEPQAVQALGLRAEHHPELWDGGEAVSATATCTCTASVLLHGPYSR